jgi:hypothetical protein
MQSLTARIVGWRNRLIRIFKTYYFKYKKPRRYKKYHERYPQHHQRHKLPVSARIDGIANQLEAYKEQQESSERKRRAREILTIVGLFGAAFFAALQWRVFRQQAADFRDQGQRQLRAYVFPDDVSIENADADLSKAESAAPRFDVKIKNYGITPAYNVTNIVGGTFAPFPLNIGQVWHLNSGQSISVFFLPPGRRDQAFAYILGATSPLNQEQKRLLGQGVMAIYLFGETTYIDTFDKLRCTRFIYYVGGDAGFNGSAVVNAKNGGQDSDRNCEIPTLQPRDIILPIVPHYKL